MRLIASNDENFLYDFRFLVKFDGNYIGASDVYWAGKSLVIRKRALERRLKTAKGQIVIELLGPTKKEVVRRYVVKYKDKIYHPIAELHGNGNSQLLEEVILTEADMVEVNT